MISQKFRLTRPCQLFRLLWALLPTLGGGTHVRAHDYPALTHSGSPRPEGFSTPQRPSSITMGAIGCHKRSQLHNSPIPLKSQYCNTLIQLSSSSVDFSPCPSFPRCVLPAPDSARAFTSHYADIKSRHSATNNTLTPPLSPPLP